MDRAHRWTDEQIEALERRMSREYGTAVREMRSKLERHLAGYEEGLAKRTADLDGTPEAKKALEAWKRDQATNRRYLDGMVESLAGDATEATQRAVALVEDRLPGIYAENANWAAFEVDRAARVDTAFNLQDESTVRELMGRGERLFEPPRPNAAKVRAWTEQKLTATVTQGILQGESIPHIADRMAEVYGSDRAAAVRAARTACTGAENAGRVSSYERARRLGIGLRQEWMATLDSRTRDSHRVLDGERVEVGEEFSNGLRFPGDPQGPAREVYNCRCTLVAAVDGIDQSDAARFSRLPDGMSYEDWKEQARARMAGQQVGEPDIIRTPERHVVEGKDILGTWQRRPDKFDFEIEDVMAAQGFDGLPRIVDADEFDRAVRAANNGDGLVMQRSYSAPDQTKLDAYRDMLYNGKWYVDCSEGGAQYGRGMYAAADYTGTLTDGIRKEMRHYSELREETLSHMKVSDDIKEKFVENWVRENLPTSQFEDAMMYARFEMFEQGNFPEVREAVNRMGDDVRKRINIEACRQADYLTYDNPVSYVETMTLDPSAKIVTHADLRKMKDDYGRDAYAWLDEQKALHQQMYRDGKITPDEGRALDKESTDEFMRMIERSQAVTSMDDGSFAAGLGYDAINAEGHGQSGSYTVVLNRTKLIIRRPE